jgi:hypothetical protein
MWVKPDGTGAALIETGSLPHPPSHIEHPKRKTRHQLEADDASWDWGFGFAVLTAIGTLRPTGRRPAYPKYLWS